MGRHTRWEPPNPVLRDHRAPRGGILVIPPAVSVVDLDRAGRPTGETTDLDINPLKFLFGDRSCVVKGCDCDYCTWDPVVDAEIVDEEP